MTHLRLRDLPQQLKPRERAEQMGMHTLSDAELIAILLRVGNRKENVMQLAQRIIVTMEGDWSRWNEWDAFAWKAKGLGRVQILTLQAAVELGQRIKQSPHLAPQTLAEGMEWIRSRVAHSSHEWFFLLALDARDQLIGLPIKLSEGNRTYVNVDPKKVVSLLTQRDACACVLVHNHPSRNAEPSPQDLMLTKRLAEALEWVEIKLLDHCIIAGKETFSFKENGALD